MKTPPPESKSASEVLIGHALDHMESDPLATQIELYEAMADFAGSPADAERFRKEALALTKSLNRQRILRLDFHNR